MRVSVDKQEFDVPDDATPEEIDQISRQGTPAQQESVRQFVATPAQQSMPKTPVYHDDGSHPYADWLTAHGEGLTRTVAGGSAALGSFAVTKNPISAALAGLGTQDAAGIYYRNSVNNEPVPWPRLAHDAAVGIGGGLGGAGGAAVAEGVGAGTAGALGLGMAGAGMGGAIAGKLADTTKHDPNYSPFADFGAASLGHLAGGVDAAVGGAIKTKSLSGGVAGWKQYFTGTPDTGVSPADMVDRNQQTPFVKEAVGQLSPEERARLAETAKNGGIVTPTMYNTNDPRRARGVTALTDLRQAATAQQGAATDQLGSLQGQEPGQPVPVPPRYEAPPGPMGHYPPQPLEDPSIRQDAIKDFLSKRQDSALSKVHDPKIAPGPDLPPNYINDMNQQSASVADQIKKSASPDAVEFLKRTQAGIEKETANRSKIFNDEVDRKNANRSEQAKSDASWQAAADAADPTHPETSDAISKFLQEREKGLQAKVDASKALHAQQKNREIETNKAADSAEAENAATAKANADRDTNMQQLAAQVKDLNIRREALAGLGAQGKGDDAMPHVMGINPEGMAARIMGGAKALWPNHAWLRDEAPIVSERLLGDRILNGAGTAPTVRPPVGGVSAPVPWTGHNIALSPRATDVGSSILHQWLTADNPLSKKKDPNSGP